MDYLEMKLEAVSFPNLARLTNLSKFAKAKFKNDDVKFDVKFWKITPKNKSNLTRKLKCLKRFLSLRFISIFMVLRYPFVKVDIP